MYDFRYHLLGWIVFCSLENSVALILVENSLKKFPKYLAHLPFEISYFYIVSFLIFRYPFVSDKEPFALPKQLARLLVTLFIFIAANIPIWYFFLFGVPNNTPNISMSIGAGLYRGVYLLGYAVAFGLGLRLVKAVKRNTSLRIREIRREQAKSEIEKELIIAQNAYLQTRINPHLLMNSLNFVYNSVEMYSEQAAELIDILSRIMRYALREPETDGKVFLIEEWNQVELLLQLQQIRFGKQFNIQKTVRGDLSTFRIPPILLLTFVENIFKHGDVYGAEKLIELTLIENNGSLYFSTKNKIAATKSHVGTNIGLENARVRIKALYNPLDQNLNVSTDNDIFALELNLTA